MRQRARVKQHRSKTAAAERDCGGSSFKFSPILLKFPGSLDKVRGI
jgi:hypothetical protein